ncbi:MAG: tetratricopeptide repeat protein [Methanobacterium sp.]|uniref:tetratricopeptide repeat protein n=1 Tax=Methanobacterium sp. TaxID=2164 RepID=UPI003D64867E|nr:tetratricopeptide repeat protein [Methanobacterium sp.]
MDIIILLGAILLAYGGMLILYYYLRSKERKKATSDSMLKGLTSMRRGNLDKALFYFDKAYEYSIENNSREEMAEALYSIGIVYKEKGENDNAMEYFNSSIDVYRELQDNEGLKKVMLASRSIRKVDN